MAYCTYAECRHVGLAIIMLKIIAFCCHLSWIMIKTWSIIDVEVVICTLYVLDLHSCGAERIWRYCFLQSKAKEMVQLAEKMRLKLLSNSTAQANSNDEEMGSKQDMQDWLLSVGIVSPVTKESAGALYHQQLSRQVICNFIMHW